MSASKEIRCQKCGKLLTVSENEVLRIKSKHDGIDIAVIDGTLIIHCNGMINNNGKKCKCNEVYLVKPYSVYTLTRPEAELVQIIT